MKNESFARKLYRNYIDVLQKLKSLKYSTNFHFTYTDFLQVEEMEIKLKILNIIRNWLKNKQNLLN